MDPGSEIPDHLPGHVPLDHVLRWGARTLSDPLARKILEGDLAAGARVTVDYDAGTESFTFSPSGSD